MKVSNSPSDLHLTLESLNIKNNSMNVFEEGGAYINCHRMFFAYHEKFPNVITLRNTHYEKAIRWIETKHQDRIINVHFRSRTLKRKQKNCYVDVIYIMHDEMIIDIENNGTVVILFTNKSESYAKGIEEQIRKFFKRDKASSSINLLTEGHFGLDLHPIKNKKPKLDLNLNYNDDLRDVHTYLVQALNKKNKSGLVLLHGMPGTGKSTYIRFLVHSVKKNIIFLPPKIAANLDSPSMTSFLIENANSIFIIEDAEEIIKSREGKNESNISMLLNLTDGILGDSLGIQIVCTFNTRTNNIDKALMRKGRLIASYEFKELQAMKSQILLDKLGTINYIVDRNMTLADIYNIEEQKKIFNVSYQCQIGFKLA